VKPWRPLPDSNRNRRFRKPELYPVELRGRALLSLSRAHVARDRMIWRLMIWRSKDRFTAENAEFSEEPKFVFSAYLVISALKISLTTDG
jgi:hypothetical protein